MARVTYDNLKIANNNMPKYIDDGSRHGQHVIDHVGMKNPIAEALDDTDVASFHQSEHVFEYVNKFKLLEIGVASAGNSRPMHINSKIFGAWRKTNPAGIEVDSRVLLLPKEKSFKFSYSNKYGNAWKALEGASGLKMLQQAAEALRVLASITGQANESTAGGKFVSRFSEAPVWESTAPIKLDGSLNLEFYFGQAGLFNCAMEVVQPIFALSSLFSPIMGEKNGGHENYVRGPLPTPPLFIAKMFKSAVGGVKQAIDGGKNAAREESEGSGFGKMVNDITEIEKKIMEVQSNAIQEALDLNSRALYIRMGRMSLGPFLVKDVNWEFDFEHTDEFGFPYKGNITFGGLENIVMPTPQQWIYSFHGDGGSEIFSRERTGTAGDGLETNLTDEQLLNLTYLTPNG